MPVKSKIKKNKFQRAESTDKVSYHRKPLDLSLDKWQRALRRQFVIDKYFKITKLGTHPVFTDYLVYNPDTQNSYKVALRDNKIGLSDSMNFCSCMDFKTNRLGTCKHLEAVFRQVRSNMKYDYLLQQGYNAPYTSVYLHYGENREVRIRIGTENSEAFKELAVNYFDKNVLKPDAFSQFENFLTQAREINEEFRCYDDAMEYILAIREHQQRNISIDERYPSETNLNNLLKTNLFPYQQDGVLFAAKAGRCLIADEMGLGKTVQAIGAVELMKREKCVQNILIICPTSLKYQWQSELIKFTESTVKVIEGLINVRAIQYKGDEQYKIVSYQTAGRDINNINAAEFDLVILDEAQRIKNWKTQLAKNIKKIKSNYAVVLTGTPLENKLEDLYSIMQFVDPFKLGPYFRFLDHHQVKNEVGKVVGYKNLHEISDKMSNVMVRRLKSDVLTQLPERMDKNLFVPMTEEQSNHHKEFADTVARLVQKWRLYGFLSESDRQRLLISLNCMRMVCDSTYILDQIYEKRSDTKIDELMNILDEVFESSNEKVVIFSQWMRMTYLVSRELDARGIKYEYLYGGVPSAKRKDLFDRFNNTPDCRVFLSTDAGSTGLNLQSASMVINLDIPWNPAVLEQRIARVHRMGQKSNVSVINFVANGTIEHRMLFVLGFKSALAQGVLDKGEDAIFMDSDSFTKFMETVEAVTVDIQDEEAGISEEEALESVEMGSLPPKLKEEEPYFDGDDDVKPIETVTPQRPDDQPSAETKPTQPDMQDLLANGLRFLGGLAQALSTPESTEKLVSSIVEKDEKTGRSYMKIPVDDQQTVVNVVNMLGQLFRGMGK